MPRKSARENGGFRRTGWKAKLAKREADEKRIVKNIYIGASNARRWIILKKKLEYRSDVDFVAYLLNLAEPFSGKGKLERKDKEDDDGKNNPIPRVPDIIVEEDNTESQEKETERVVFNEVAEEVGESRDVKVVEEEGQVVGESGGVDGDNEEEEEEDDEEEDDEDDDDEEEEEEDEEGSGGEWTGGRQPLRRSLRSIPTNKGAKMSVRRSARNARREEEDEDEEEIEEERGEGVGGELAAGLRKKKRGDKSQRRQRRRERKKRRRRKRLKGSGGESTEEEEEESEIESEGEARELIQGDEGLRNEAGVLETAVVPSVEEHPVMEQDNAPMIVEPPKKGRRGRKKKVVVPEVPLEEGVAAAKIPAEPEVGVPAVMAESAPPETIVSTPREADSMTLLEDTGVLMDPESDRLSKHHRHHRRKSRKSKDGLDEEGCDEEGDGDEDGGETGETGTGKRKKRRRRGRARREEEGGVEDVADGLGDDQGEENFPRYEVVEAVSEEGDLNQQEKPQIPVQITSQEEGVLIEVGERVKLKRRRKRRHSRGEEGEGGDNEGVNGDAVSSEDPLNVLRKATKHKKRKHAHGEGHGNRRKHHDVRKVPVDGILSESSPTTASSLHPEGSPEALGSPDPSTPTTPTSSTTPPSTTIMNKGGDNKQRVAIRITLCGECDSRHVLDACPLKRPLTIIHDSVVLRNNVGDEQSKDEITEGISQGDTDTKSFATEEEEEMVDGEDTQDTECKIKKKDNEDDEAQDSVISEAVLKDSDERQHQRNGLTESVEERIPVPNGKFRPGTDRVSAIAQDTVKHPEPENGDIIGGDKIMKDEMRDVDENKLDSQEEMLANGDASTTSNSTSASKPMVVDTEDMESANETLTSQPSPLPMPEPISTADSTVGNGNNVNGGKTFAEASLPMALKLETREAGHGPGVTARRPIARFTQFGPLLGRRIREMDIPDDFGMRHIWEVIGASGRFLISTEDASTSNWLRFIRPAPTREQRNVAPVTRGDRLYFVTTAPLQVGEELLYWPDESSGSGAPPGASQSSSAQVQNTSSNGSSTSSASSTGTGWAKKKMEKTNCGGCNLRFGHPLYYRLHCSVFHDPNFSLTIRKYHCKVCGAAVLGKENIMRHAAENHDGKGAYQCQFCKKFFLRLNYLEMHRTYGCAANPQRTRPLCDFCGRKFCQPQKLKVHIKRMHSDMADVLREFQCKLCLKLLGSRAALQRHMKEVHHRDVVGACACDRCGKTFQNKSNLKIHMLTHSGVKPFRCREGNCPAAFTTKQCLQFHYKKVHGYGEDNMPVIERCVAYTFDAYSGGTVEDPGRGKVPLFSSSRLDKEQEDSSASNPAPDSEVGDDESSVGGRSLSPQRGRKDQGEIRREKGGTRGRGRRPGRPVGRTNGPREVKECLQPKPILESDSLVEAMVPSVIPEDILTPSDADVLPPPPPVIPNLPEPPECKEAMLGNMADSQPPPLTPQPGPLPTEVAPQTPTLEAYNGGQSALGPAPTIGPYAEHTRVSYPGKVVSKGSKKWMGDGSVPMRTSLEAEMEEEEEDEEEDEEDDEDEVKRVGDEGVVGDGQVVGDVYGAFPDDSRFVPVAEDGDEGFRRPEESNASLLVEAALDAAERDMSGVAVTDDDAKPHQEAEGGGGYLTSPPRANGPERHMDEDDHQRILHHPQPSHHAHHHLQHHHHLSLHHHQLPPPHHPHHHVHHHLPPASHLHVQGGALMLHHPHHHHPSHHAVMHQEEDEEEERMGPGSEAASVGTIVERIVNTSLAEEEEGDGRDDVPHPGVRGMHLLHPDAYAPDPHGRLPPAGSLPSPRNMTLLGMKAAVKVEEELHMAAMQQQQQQREEEEEGLDMSYKHGTGHYGRAVSSMAHHMQEEEEVTQGVGVGDPSADDLQDFRVLRSPPVEGRFEQSQQGLDMSRGSFPFALPAARCFPLYEGSTSAADVARSVDLRRAGLAYTSPPLPPYSQSLDLTPMRTRHSVDLSLPRTLVGTDGVGPPQGGGGQSPPPPPSPMHRHLCHAPPASPHHHVHHHHGVDPLGCVVGGDDGGEGGSGGLSPPAAYQPGAYLHAPPSYHRQPPQHPPSPPPSPYHPQARTAPHMPPPPSASPSPYHHYSSYY